MEIAKANVMRMRIPKISKLSETDPRRTKTTAQGSNSMPVVKTSSKSDEKDEQKSKSSNKSRSSSSDKKKSSSVSPKSSPSKKKRESGDAKSSSKSSSEKSSKYKEDRLSSKTKSYSRRNRDNSDERITSTVTSTNSAPPLTTGINLPLPTTETGDVDLRLLIPEKKIKLDDVSVVNLNNENDANSRNSTSDQSKTILLKIVDFTLNLRIAINLKIKCFCNNNDSTLRNYKQPKTDEMNNEYKKYCNCQNSLKKWPNKYELFDIIVGYFMGFMVF